MSELDDFDKKILKILQKDNQTRQRDIATQVCLSPAAVHRRIKRMESDGTILQNTAVLSPERLGRPTTIVVEIYAVSEQIDLLDKMKEDFSSCKEVQQCYYVTGEADFILILTVTNMQEYEAITRKLFFAEKNVKRFKTLVVMDSVKMELSVPL
jgi:Lrp/AsnC family leucine-responsive transcriptional regulator